jgi:DNA-binding transcriptional MerR regulator
MRDFKVFSARQAARIAGVPYPTLDDWGRRGYVVPSVQTASGRGSARQYSGNDIVALVAASLLRDFGVPPTRLAQLLAHIRGRPELTVCGDGPDEFLLLGTDGSISVVHRDEVLKALKVSAVAQLVNLKELVNLSTARGMELLMLGAPATRSKPNPMRPAPVGEDKPTKTNRPRRNRKAEG